MDFKEIKAFMEALEQSGLKKLIIKDKEGSELHLEKSDFISPLQHPYVSPPSPHPKEKLPKPSELPAKPEAHEEHHYVTSPMVSIFYSASSPDDPPLVKVGDCVEEDSVVCIIEAMKVMNEVKAGVSGIVKEISVENAHPIEFGTKLFRIE